MRRMEEEEADLPEFIDFRDTLERLGRFLDEVYNPKRNHRMPAS